MLQRVGSCNARTRGTDFFRFTAQSITVLLARKQGFGSRIVCGTSHKGCAVPGWVGILPLLREVLTVHQYCFSTPNFGAICAHRLHTLTYAIVPVLYTPRQIMWSGAPMFWLTLCLQNYCLDSATTHPNCTFCLVSRFLGGSQPNARCASQVRGRLVPPKWDRAL